MTQHNVCRNCRHWNTMDTIYRLPTQNHRVCRLATAAHAHTGAPSDHIVFVDTVHDPFVGGELITRADFGCNQFEERQETR